MPPTDEQVAAMRAVGRTWKGPKSFCTCGHAGDGDGVDVDTHVSTHGSIDGHGVCFVSGCECRKFTWSAHTHTYEAALQKAKTETI